MKVERNAFVHHINCSYCFSIYILRDWLRKRRGGFRRNTFQYDASEIKYVCFSIELHQLSQ